MNVTRTTSPLRLLKGGASWCKDLIRQDLAKILTLEHRFQAYNRHFQIKFAGESLDGSSGVT